MSGGFERRRARTVVPVPPGTDRHQPYSVPPTDRIMGLEGSVVVSEDMIDLGETESQKMIWVL